MVSTISVSMPSRRRSMTTRLTLDRYRDGTYHCYLLHDSAYETAAGFIVPLSEGFHWSLATPPGDSGGDAATLIDAWDAAEAAYNEREGDAA